MFYYYDDKIAREQIEWFFGQFERQTIKAKDGSLIDVQLLKTLTYVINHDVQNLIEGIYKNEQKCKKK